jgi:hypothetical protein
MLIESALVFLGGWLLGKEGWGSKAKPSTPTKAVWPREGVLPVSRVAPTRVDVPRGPGAWGGPLPRGKLSDELSPTDLAARRGPASSAWSGPLPGGTAEDELSPADLAALRTKK